MLQFKKKGLRASNNSDNLEGYILKIMPNQAIQPIATLRLISTEIFSQNWPKIQRSRIGQGFGIGVWEEKTKQITKFDLI